MPKPYTPTETNTPSKLNRIVNALTPAGITIGASFIPATSPEYAAIYATLALGATILAKWSWIKRGASVSTDLNDEVYQGLYIVPSDNGSQTTYVVSKPFHSTELNERHPYRKLLRDGVQKDNVEIIGRFATKQLAEDACFTTNGQSATFLDPQTCPRGSDWESIAQSTLEEMERQRKSDASQDLEIFRTVPLTPWRISPTSSNAHSNTKEHYVAYRKLRTDDGNYTYEIFPTPPQLPYEDTLVLKRDLCKSATFSALDHNVLDAPREYADILPSWRSQAIAAKGLDYYVREIAVEDCDPAMPSAESWAVERSPNSTQWRAVQTETRFDRTVRRVLVQPEDPMMPWEETSPKAFAEFFARQGITIDPPAQQPVLNAPHVKSPQASLSQPRMRK